MWSLGAVAFGWDSETRWRISHMFSVNIENLEGAAPDAETMRVFWAKQPVAWAKAKENQVSPSVAMQQFAGWLKDVKTHWNGRYCTGVAGPAGFDFPFVRYYMLKFLGHSRPFNHRCDDMRSRAATVLRIPYAEAGKAAYPRHWFKDKLPHTHVALEDALEQASLYMRMMDDLYSAGT